MAVWSNVFTSHPGIAPASPDMQPTLLDLSRMHANHYFNRCLTQTTITMTCYTMHQLWLTCPPTTHSSSACEGDPQTSVATQEQHQVPSNYLQSRLLVSSRSLSLPLSSCDFFPYLFVHVTGMLHGKPLHTRNTPSSSCTMPLLNRPVHSKATLDDRSFSFASSSVWKSTPNVRCAPSLSSFKSRLKTYLFRSVYKDWTVSLITVHMCMV